MENSIIEELIGGMPSWTEEANCKGADADIFFRIISSAIFGPDKTITLFFENLVS